MARKAAIFQMADGFSGSIAQVAEHYSVPENVVRKRVRAGATAQEAVAAILRMREQASAQQAKWRDDPVSATSSMIADMAQALTPDRVMQQVEMNMQPAVSAGSAEGHPSTDFAAGRGKNGRELGSKSPSNAKKHKKLHSTATKKGKSKRLQADGDDGAHSTFTDSSMQHVSNATSDSAASTASEPNGAHAAEPDFTVSKADWSALMQQMERMNSMLANLSGMMQELMHARMQVEVRLLPENGWNLEPHH